MMLGGVGKSGSPISRWTMLRPWASSLRALASTSKAVSVPISSIRWANFIGSSSHSKGSKVAAVVAPVDADVVDARHPRALPKRVEKLLQGRRVALGLHLHGAIVAVADGALQAQAAGVRLGEESETDPLDVTKDFRLEPAAILGLFTRQSGVSERARRDHDGYALRRVGNRPERATDDRQIGLNQLERRLLGGRADDQVLVVAVATCGGPFPQVERRVGQVQAQKELELLPDCSPLHWA